MAVWKPALRIELERRERSALHLQHCRQRGARRPDAVAQAEPSRSSSAGRAGCPGSRVAMALETLLRITVSSLLKSCARAAAATAQA
jgi:hypothetical protein